MKGLEYRDTRMTFELFRLKDPSCAERPWQNPEPEVEVVLDFKASSFQEAGQITKHWNIHHPEAVHYWRHKRSRSDYGLWHEDGICSWGLSDVDNYFVDKVAALRKQLRELDKELNSTEKDILHLKILRNRRIQILRKIVKTRKLSVNKFIRMLVKFRFAISDWCGWWLKDFWADRFRDLRWWFKKFISLHRTGHSPDEWWTLELHLLETLKFNLKRLNEEGMGISPEFIQEVLDEMNKGNPNYDPEKAFASYCGCGEEHEEVFDKAVQRQKDTYSHIIHLVDLYTFYFNQEVNDKDIYEHPELRTPDMREIYLECSYDELDYKAMADRGTECWNEIWDLVKKYGQGMGD